MRMAIRRPHNPSMRFFSLPMQHTMVSRGIEQKTELLSKQASSLMLFNKIVRVMIG